MVIYELNVQHQLHEIYLLFGKLKLSLVVVDLVVCHVTDNGELLQSTEANEEVDITLKNFLVDLSVQEDDEVLFENVKDDLNDFVNLFMPDDLLNPNYSSD